MKARSSAQELHKSNLGKRVDKTKMEGNKKQYRKNIKKGKNKRRRRRERVPKHDVQLVHRGVPQTEGMSGAD